MSIPQEGQTCFIPHDPWPDCDALGNVTRIEDTLMPHTFPHLEALPCANHCPNPGKLPCEDIINLKNNEKDKTRLSLALFDTSFEHVHKAEMNRSDSGIKAGRRSVGAVPALLIPSFAGPLWIQSSNFETPKGITFALIKVASLPDADPKVPPRYQWSKERTIRVSAFQQHNTGPKTDVTSTPEPSTSGSE
ncbi:hypothetical protein V8E55_007807 [Tylopilus felleus]